MKLVQASDDFGYSIGWNYGLKKVMPYDSITHINIMTDTPGNIDAFKFVKEHPYVSVAWHQHFRGKPVADPKLVSSLLSEDGHFKFRDVWNKDTFNQEARNKRYEGLDYDQLVIEFRAELEQMYAYAGRFHDFGGGKGDNPVARATNQVCEEFKIPSTKQALAQTGREMVHIHQPGDATYLVRINEDSYIRNCTYDPLAYLRNDPQGILKNECSQIAWHAGFYDDEVFTDGSYFYDGDQRYFEPSPLLDVAMLISDGFRDWVKENKVELVSMTDAVYGTNTFQEHLKQVGSDLYYGNF